MGTEKCFSRSNEKNACFHEIILKKAASTPSKQNKSRSGDHKDFWGKFY